MQNLFLVNNIKDGTLLPQVITGGTGTRPKAGGAHEFNSFSFSKMVCCSSFRLQLMRSAATDGVCRTVHLIRHFVSCSQHALIVAHHTAWLKNVLVRVISFAWSSTLCGCPFLDSLFLALFLSVFFSYPLFFYLNLELNLFLHVAVIGAISHWHSAN